MTCGALQVIDALIVVIAVLMAARDGFVLALLHTVLGDAGITCADSVVIAPCVGVDTGAVGAASGFAGIAGGTVHGSVFADTIDTGINSTRI